MRTAISSSSRLALHHLRRVSVAPASSSPSPSRLLSQSCNLAAEQDDNARPYIPPSPPPFPSSSTSSSISSGPSSTPGSNHKPGSRPPTASDSKISLTGSSTGTLPMARHDSSDTTAAGQDKLWAPDRFRWASASSLEDRKGKGRDVLYDEPHSAFHRPPAPQEAEDFEPLGPAPRWSSLTSVFLAYPHLNHGQARLVLLLRRHAELHKPRPVPARLLAWYLELLWQQRRQVTDSEARLCESAESLAVLLRFAFRSEDAEMLAKLAPRASQWAAAHRGRRYGAAPRQPGPQDDQEVSSRWVAGWPPAIDPEELSYVLRITLAARDGNWKKVNRLLSELSKATGVFDQSGINTQLSSFVLNALVRHGLAQPIKDTSATPEEDETATARRTSRGSSSQASSTTPLPASRKSRRKLRAAEANAEAVNRNATEVSAPVPEKSEDQLLHEQYRQRFSEAMQTERQQTAAMLLPPLLSRLGRESVPLAAEDDEAESGDAAARPDQAAGAGARPPMWLFMSTLNNLADAGESQRVLSMVVRYLSEKRSEQAAASSEEASAQQDEKVDVVFPVTRPGATKVQGTTLLNVVMRAYNRDDSARFDDLCRVFAQLTSVELDGQIRKRPEEFKSFGRSRRGGVEDEGRAKGREEGSSEEPKAGEAEVAADEEGAKEAKTERFHLIPNEQTLLYLLDKLPAHLFSASWSFKLVQLLCDRFAPFVVTTRSYVHVLRFCLASRRPQVAHRVLRHYREQTAALLDHFGGDMGRLRVRIEATIGGGRGASAVRVSKIGRKRFEWRQVLLRLVKAGWVERGAVRSGPPYDDDDDDDDNNNNNNNNNNDNNNDNNNNDNNDNNNNNNNNNDSGNDGEADQL
ncbi:hypothetical protein ACQY0O_004318 [Thecaphora frezii]